MKISKIFLFSLPTHIASIIFAMLVVLSTSNSMADVIHIIDTNGKLIGAKNVLVAGQLFDVEFKEGSANSIFLNGSTFDAVTSASAIQFSQALMDTVFVDNSLGYFDSNSDLTFGCFGWFGCKVFTPYALGFSAVAGNAKSNAPQSDYVSTEFYSAERDTSFNNDSVYADWSVSPTAVPIPAASWLMGSGLIGLAGIARRKK